MLLNYILDYFSVSYRVKNIFHEFALSTFQKKAHLQFLPEINYRTRDNATKPKKGSRRSIILFRGEQKKTRYHKRALVTGNANSKSVNKICSKIFYKQTKFGRDLRAGDIACPSIAQRKKKVERQKTLNTCSNNKSPVLITKPNQYAQRRF